MRCYRSSSFHPGRERGAVLFVSLVFLVLITLLALTATSTSILQERMTGGVHNSQLALMGAETTLRGAEWSIWNRSNLIPGSNKLHCGPTGGVTNDACYTDQAGVNATVLAFRNAKNWLGNSGDGAKTYPTTSLNFATSSAKATASLESQPRYMMEDLGEVLPPGAPSNGMGGGRLGTVKKDAGAQNLYSYRITARATGGNQGSVRAAESIYVALPPSS